MARALLIFTLLLANAAAWAQSSIYRTTDENGNVVFTDAPPANARNAEKVEIQPTNTTPPVEKREPTKAEREAIAQEKAASEVQEVTITMPQNEEAIPMGPGNFSVAVKVQPKLEAEQSLQLFMDGVPYGPPQRSATWDLTNVFRGTHKLTVGITDEQGETPVMSQPVTVYVLRPRIR